jgi:hypothetical protein
VGVLQAFWPQLSCNCRLSLPRVWADKCEPLHSDVGQNEVLERFLVRVSLEPWYSWSQAPKQ